MGFLIVVHERVRHELVLPGPKNLARNSSRNSRGHWKDMSRSQYSIVLCRDLFLVPNLALPVIFPLLEILSFTCWVRGCGIVGVIWSGSFGSK